MTASSVSNDNASTDGAPRSIFGNLRSIFVGRLLSALSMWLALVVLAKLSDRYDGRDLCTGAGDLHTCRREREDGVA